MDSVTGRLRRLNLGVRSKRPLPYLFDFKDARLADRLKARVKNLDELPCCHVLDSVERRSEAVRASL